MKTQLFIGQSQLRGALSKYASRFNFLEVRAESGKAPRPTVLRRWTEEVNPQFVFSVLLSRQVGQFGSNSESALKLGLEVADALQAKWLVVQTDPTVGPSNRTRDRLKGLFTRLSEGGRNVAWEPHGAWQDEDAIAWTHDLGVHLVHDITRGEPVSEEILYVRIPGLGTSARLSSGAIENAAESLVHASEAYIVIGGEAPGRAAQMFRAVVREFDDESKISSSREGPFVFDESTLESGATESEELNSDNEEDEEWDDAVDEDGDDEGLGEDDESVDDDDVDEEFEEEDGPKSAGAARKGAKRK